MTPEEFNNLPEETQQIALDLLGALGNLLPDNEFNDSPVEIDDVEFCIQKGYELVPVWYVRREVVIYETKDGGRRNKLFVVFRPNLKKKNLLKPDWLRTAPQK